jgi:threonine dehydratase
MLRYYPKINDIKNASKILRNIFEPTPLSFESDLSVKYNSKIYLKREDMTPVRSYKIRGAINKLNSLQKEHGSVEGIVSCSAGNHAQGVAFGCNKLEIPGFIFMPKNTTKQKIDKVEKFGGKWVKIYLEGNNFDESNDAANKCAKEKNLQFVHPFDDEKVIEGQGTVGLEILDQIKEKKIDYLFLPVGGGGLSAGVSSYFKSFSPATKIIGVEPLGAPSLTEAMKKGKVVKLDTINTFVDGASVKKIGDLNFPIIKKNLDDILLVDEGHVCSKILEIYNNNGLIIEPAGILSLCALDLMKHSIVDKTVVSIISGSNSDVFRMPEILDRSLTYEGKKHYFKIEFAQKAGALKNFILSILGPNDDIILFRYTKIINQETGPVIIGIENKSKDDADILMDKMKKNNISFEKISPSSIYA